MERSLVTIDAGAIRDNARRLCEALGSAELWAVVKADGYGHGADVTARAALEGGARALCVATVAEGIALRARERDVRIIVLGPTAGADLPQAREGRLELVVPDGRVPEGIPVHLKLDTGMGRWGLAELPATAPGVVGLMTHFASAESDAAFTRLQLERFLTATEPYPGLIRHAANSAAALSFPRSHLDAARCGIALYGIDPMGRDARDHGLRPALRWTSTLAQVKVLAAGESTGYGRRFVATRPTWIGLVPVGYADGFPRDLSGTEVLVDGEPRRVVGTVSMDVIAVELAAPEEVGTAVTLVGDGVTLETHAAVAGTIAYELACGIRRDGLRSRVEVVDA